MLGQSIGPGGGSRAAATTAIRPEDPSEASLTAARIVFMSVIVALFLVWLMSANTATPGFAEAFTDAHCALPGRGGADRVMKENGDVDGRQGCPSFRRGGVIRDERPTK